MAGRRVSGKVLSLRCSGSSHGARGGGCKTYQVGVAEADGLPDGDGHEHVTAADVARFAVVVLDRRVGLELLHRRLRQDVSAAAVVEVAVLRGLEATEEVVLVRIKGAQHLDHVRPVDVRVGVDVDVPFVVGTHSVRHVGLANVLVLVEVPRLAAGIAPFLAALLVDEAFLLTAVEVEVAVAVLGILDRVLEDVIYAVSHQRLLHVGEDEEVGQAPGHGHELGGEAVIGLAGARLDDEQDLGEIGEVCADGVDGSCWEPVILREDLLIGALLAGALLPGGRRRADVLRWRFLVLNVGVRGCCRRRQ